MDKMEKVFRDFNEELKKENLSLGIICVGGYVLEYNGLRATQDIDAFYEEDEKIKEIIKKVGDKFDINTEEELWLNNSVSSMNKIPPLHICKVIYNFENLIVYMAPIEYESSEYERTRFDRYWRDNQI